MEDRLTAREAASKLESVLRRVQAAQSAARLKPKAKAGSSKADVKPLPSPPLDRSSDPGALPAISEELPPCLVRSLSSPGCTRTPAPSAPSSRHPDRGAPASGVASCSSRTSREVHNSKAAAPAPATAGAQPRRMCRKPATPKFSGLGRAAGSGATVPGAAPLARRAAPRAPSRTSKPGEGPATKAAAPRAHRAAATGHQVTATRTQDAPRPQPRWL